MKFKEWLVATWVLFAIWVPLYYVQAGGFTVNFWLGTTFFLSVGLVSTVIAVKNREMFE